MLRVFASAVQLQGGRVNHDGAEVVFANIALAGR